MAQSKAWAEIGDSDDDDDRSNSPVVDLYGPSTTTTAAQNLEYKLQPTGEVVSGNRNHRGDGQGQRRPPQKKPLLTSDEMVEQISEQNGNFVYLHCFGVNGSAEDFKKVFESKVRIANIIDAKNEDRDNSLDLKFDNKDEAINFIKLAQSTGIEGRNFRVKFGRNSKKGERDNRDNRDNREGRDNRERREPRNGRGENRRGGDNQGGENRFTGQRQNQHSDNYQGRSKNEFPTGQKRNFNAAEKKEDTPATTTATTTTENQVPAEPFKPRGFVNSKKETAATTATTPATTGTEAIHCVDLNAKILQRQEKEALEKKEEPAQKARESSKKRDGSKRRDGSKKREGSKNKDKKETAPATAPEGRRNRKESAKIAAEKDVKKETSKGRQEIVYVKKSEVESQAATKTQSNKQAQQKTKQPQEQQQVAEKKPEPAARSESKKKLKLQTENTTFEDDWTVVPTKEKKPAGGNNNNSSQGKKEDKKPRENRGNNNNNKNESNKGEKKENTGSNKPKQPKEKTTYERKDNQQKPQQE